MLAADLKYDPASGFWQIQKIYRGDYPDPQWSFPLAKPDLRVGTGEWLVAIDGKPLIQGEDYMKRLAGRARQEVELSINEAPRSKAGGASLSKLLQTISKSAMPHGSGKPGSLLTRRATGKSAISIYTTWVASVCVSSRAISRLSGGSEASLSMTAGIMVVPWRR